MATYLTHIKHLVLYFRDCELEDVQLSDIISYMEAMTNLGWDQNSIVFKSGVYRQFFGFFQKQDLIKMKADMIPTPARDHKFPKIIEEPDYKKLLKAINIKGIRGLRTVLILQLLWDTGVRLNELRSLDVVDMDTGQMRAVIKTEKSRGIKPTRMIFWTKETNETLIKYIGLRNETIVKMGVEDSGALIINLWGRWTAGNRFSETSIESLMARLSREANLGYIANPHRFRHRFGRNLALQGANNSTISDMMGHSDINSTRIYTVMNEHMMQEAYNKYFKT